MAEPLARWLVRGLDPYAASKTNDSAIALVKAYALSELLTIPIHLVELIREMVLLAASHGAAANALSELNLFAPLALIGFDALFGLVLLARADLLARWIVTGLEKFATHPAAESWPPPPSENPV